MRKLLIFIFFLIFCNTVYANNSNFVFDLSKEEGIKLLTGEKSIALIAKCKPSAVKDKLRQDVLSDIILKFRLIGLELCDYKWGRPCLVADFALVSVTNGLYSGTVGLSFLMTAEYQKGEVPSYATVWEYTVVFANADKQEIRNSFKDMVDKFLNVYLEANPRKFINDTPDKKQQ